MNWEQKLEALNALSTASLMMRAPGDWYIGGWGVEIGDGRFLTSACCSGSTPEQAVLDCWDRHTVNLKPNEFLVVRAMQEGRQHFKWADYMWKSHNA